MKSKILSVAALGLVASSSGSHQLCQYTTNKCTGAGSNCVGLDLAEGCHKLPAIFTRLAAPRYRAAQGDDKKKLTLNVFDSNTCAAGKTVTKPIELEEKKCVKPERPEGSTDQAFQFYLKWENRLPVTKPTGIVVATKKRAIKKGAGSSVIPSLIASVTTVMLGLLF